MESPNLLQIDVRALFEQHTISDIENIHKKICENVETKKEELRVMVGERYRDLLQAADTIADMKITSSHIVNHIDTIMTNCSEINSRNVINSGFKEPEAADTESRRFAQHYSIVTQIKMLTDLPELIWMRIDDEDFFVATQLFIFSRHVSTGLQLDSNNPVIKMMPVAKKQWALLSPFFFTIKQECLTVLEREHLTVDVATKCLASLLLLENCQLDRLFATFIQLRGKTFLNALVADNNRNVKDKLMASLGVLHDTMHLLYECFVNGGRGHGRLVEVLKSLSEAGPTILLMELDDKIGTNSLPDIITKYRPHVPAVELSSEMIKTTMESWFSHIQGICKHNLKSLVGLVTSVKTFRDIKVQAMTIEKPHNWSSILESLYLPSKLDWYQFCYQPLISTRIKDIISSSWNAITDQTIAEVRLLVNSLDAEPFEASLWIEEASDIPISLKQALNPDKYTHKLLMKSKGLNPQLVDVCRSLDENLSNLFADVELYLSNQGDVMRRDGNPEELKGKEEIMEFLKETSQVGVKRLLQDTSSMPKDQHQTALVARFLVAITQLCPHLKVCLSHKVTSNWQEIGTTTTTSQWDGVSKLLKNESNKLWNSWADAFLSENVQHKYFTCELDSTFVLNEFPNWSEVSVEEKDEQDNPIQSSIRVPSQPSLILHAFLHKITTKLNGFAPSTLPKSVTTYLTHSLAQKLSNNFGRLLQFEFLATNQNAALQLYFDVKFINTLFATRDAKFINDSLQESATQLKGHIDPFDFELFHQYLNGNVKRAVFRVQQQLACWVPHLEQLTAVIGEDKSAGTLQSEKNPNVLALSASASTSAWFPLLPVTTVSAALPVEVPVAKEVVKSSRPTSAATASRDARSDRVVNQSSGQSSQNLASSFFGGLGQDWFR